MEFFLMYPRRHPCRWGLGVFAYYAAPFTQSGTVKLVLVAGSVVGFEHRAAGLIGLLHGF